MSRSPGQVARKTRVSVKHGATLVLSDGSELPVTITDISSGGFKLHADVTLPIGEHVFVRVERYGDFPAQIRWAIGDEAGGLFLEPVNITTR